MSKKYDVIVIGGGVAGVSAALAASRQQKNVALIEKQCFLGGLATSGLITIYLPLCDGKGHQVSFGIAEELLKLSIELGVQRKYPQPWLENGTFEEKKQKRYEVQYNPIYFTLMMEELLVKEGVEIIYDSLVSDVKMENDIIKSVIVETIDDRIEMFSDSFIDATGYARIFGLANVPIRKFGKGNILASWYYFIEKGRMRLNMLGTVEESDYMDKERHVDKPISNKRYYLHSYKEESQFIINSHNNMLNDMKKRICDDSLFEAVTFPSMPQIRMTTCHTGIKVLDMSHGIYQEDSIGMVADWRRRGYSYEIPFSALRSNNVKNLFSAGRCISVDDEMWDVCRVIPACAVTGEASGIAASIYSENSEINIKELQNRLRYKGQKLHLSEVE